MRLRNKPWAKDFMAEHPDVLIHEEEGTAIDWSSVFGNDNPIHVEVGTGKGQFIIGMAIANPDVNYIGIEHFDNVIVSALEKVIEAEKPSNLKTYKRKWLQFGRFIQTGRIGQNLPELFRSMAEISSCKTPFDP